MKQVTIMFCPLFKLAKVIIRELVPVMVLDEDLLEVLDARAAAFERLPEFFKEIFGESFYASQAALRKQAITFEFEVQEREMIIIL